MDSEYGKRYRELHENHWWWRAREEIVCEELRRRLADRTPVTILDVGCGDGLLFDRLQEFGGVDGIESDGRLVDPDGPHRARITIAPFDARFRPEKRYGLVLMLDVLEHLDARAAAVSHALSLLEPGGILVATVPAFQLLWTNHDRLNQHRVRFTKASFRRLAADAGMEVVSMRYFFTWLFFAKLAERVKEAVLRSEPQVPRIPSPRLNAFLCRASRAEEKLARKLGTPLGSSLLVIGRRAAEAKKG